MFKKIMFGCLASIIVGNAEIATVQAQTVSYQVLKYGTNDLSYASAYFVNPGDLVPVGDQSRAQLVIATQHTLGRFPVTILTVNQQKPTVSQSTQGSTDYYAFSFLVKDPNALLSGTMKVDVASLNYHHTYDFNLKFDAQNLPAAMQSATATPAPTSPAAATSASQVQPKTGTSTSATSQPVAQSTEPVSQTQSATPQSGSSVTSPSQSQVSTTVRTVKSATKAPKPHSQAALWLAALAGIGCGGLVIVSHRLWTKRRQKVGQHG